MLSVGKRAIDSATKTQAKRIGSQLRRVAACALVKDVDIAKRLGIPKSLVSRIMSGKSNVELRTLVKFARACDATLTISLEERNETPDEDDLPKSGPDAVEGDA